LLQPATNGHAERLGGEVDHQLGGTGNWGYSLTRLEQQCRIGRVPGRAQ
jgi:hypothetical protein